EAGDRPDEPGQRNAASLDVLGGGVGSLLEEEDVAHHGADYRPRRRSCQTRYLPVKRGGRFSTNAAAASRWSAVDMHTMWRHASLSRHSARPACSPMLRFCFMWP